MHHTTFVGLDVHAETIAVAVAKEGRGPAVSLGEIPNTAGGGGQTGWQAGPSPTAAGLL